MPTRDMPNRIVPPEEVEANHALEQMAKLGDQAEKQRRNDGYRIAALARELRLTHIKLQSAMWQLVFSIALNIALSIIAAALWIVRN